MPLFGKKQSAGAHPECPGFVQHCDEPRNADLSDESYDYDSEMAADWVQLNQSKLSEGTLPPSSGKPLANNMSYAL